MANSDFIINKNDLILVTGSNGFIGSRVVELLLEYGFTNLRCMVRPSSNVKALEKIMTAYKAATINVIKGNLQSRDDCKAATEGVSVIYHLAAGRGEKSYPDAFMNSVVTTRNLLDAVLEAGALKRFVNVSSFSVYSNRETRPGGLLDETSAVDQQPHLRGEAYCYAKVRQEQMVEDYGRKHGIPYVIMRPGSVYGPGNKGITDRVGIDTFGLFLHLGGSNKIPLSYVENCAEAIVLAGLKPGVDNQIFNVVDDDLPSSRRLLRMYKQNVRNFRSFYVPHRVSYLLCWAWEKYSATSEGQLPAAFNRRRWSASWKGNQYSNQKLKNLLGWKPRIGFHEATRLYFEYQRESGSKQ